MTYEHIRQIMDKTGLKMQPFCELIGIKVSTFYSYKTTRQPSESINKLLKLIDNDPVEMVAKLKKT